MTSTFPTILGSATAGTRRQFLMAVFEHCRGADYGDANWLKSTGGWTTPEIPTVYGRLRELRPDLDQLSLDPGFITHLPEIADELLGLSADGSGCLAAREIAERKLGCREVWRGMMLTDEGAETVKCSGVLSGLASHLGSQDDRAGEFDRRYLSVQIRNLAERHFHHENEKTPFISVTDHRDVAIAVGRHFGRRQEGARFYLLRMRVPEIDIVYYTDHGVRKPSVFSRNHQMMLAVAVDGRKVRYDWDRRVESHVLWKVDPDEILEIAPVEVSASSWNG
ncbi:MAG: hypothetical protein WCT10_00865 [Patescibacteria group bacterium]|jgi:hypothetical protein